jgi:hypothetical protein
MTEISTGARRGIAVAFIFAIATTAACGNETGATDVSTSVPGSIAQQAPFGTSADAAERRGARGQQSPTSADAAERNTQDQQAPGGKRVPDARP